MGGDKGWGFFKTLMVGTPVLIAILYGIEHIGNAPPSAQNQDAAEEILRQISIGDACKRAVTERLKAPSTADFPDRPMVAPSKDRPKIYIAWGDVDAQNSFGARLRNHFRCEVRPGERWDQATVTLVTVSK